MKFFGTKDGLASRKILLHETIISVKSSKLTKVKNITRSKKRSVIQNSNLRIGT